MTPTIKQHTQDFIAALEKDDLESIKDLPLALAKEDRAAALKAVIKAVNADEELKVKHAEVVTALSLVDLINDMVTAKASEEEGTPTVEEIIEGVFEEVAEEEAKEEATPAVEEVAEEDAPTTA